MGRPREFDENDAVTRAGEAFWAHGYEATSLADLMLATGLTKGSLYKCFSDKRSLFLRALDQYLDEGRHRLRERVEGAVSPQEALTQWLIELAELATCSGVRRGCMAVNSAIELAPHDSEIRRRLKRQDQRLEDVYARLLRAGADNGAFKSDLDPGRVARWLGVTMNGLLVRGKLGLTRREAIETVQIALDAIRA